MLRSRIIPCLLLSGEGLVKTINFTNSTYIGDPINTVKIFNEKLVDELMIFDIDATSNGIPPNYSLISSVASECRMPLCYGGGIKTVSQAERIIALGVEKIAVSSAALDDLAFISELASYIGTQSVVVVLDVNSELDQNGDTVYSVYLENGTRKVDRNFVELITDFESHGAGELVVNSIDRDGVMGGYDLDLASLVRENVKIPMSMVGGAGSLQDMRDLINICGVVGAGAGSMFFYKGIYKAVLINYPDPFQKDTIF